MCTVWHAHLRVTFLYCACDPVSARSGGVRYSGVTVNGRPADMVKDRWLESLTIRRMTRQVTCVHRVRQRLPCAVGVRETMRVRGCVTPRDGQDSRACLPSCDAGAVATRPFPHAPTAGPRCPGGARAFFRSHLEAVTPPYRCGVR